jgi:hypothetical protein
MTEEERDAKIQEIAEQQLEESAKAARRTASAPTSR